MTATEKLELAARRLEEIRLMIMKSQPKEENPATFNEDVARLERILAIAILAIEDLRQQRIAGPSPAHDTA